MCGLCTFNSITMGYSEIYCTICGASFNVARIRRQDEPREAAWAYYDRNGSYVEAEADSYIPPYGCDRDSGCLYYDRNTDIYRSPWNSSADPDTPDDEAYTDDWPEGIETGEGRYLSSYTGMIVHLTDSGIEHIAGPGCKHNGYNGHNISAEEMEGCTTFQCFIPKREDFIPASDDEDFERSANFPVYLSGLCDSMRDREMATVAEMIPMRHNMQLHVPEDIVEYYTEHPTESMPFHPWCLEVYKRASMSQTGRIGMPQLVKWHWNNSAEPTFGGRYPPQDRADDIGVLLEQWWNHKSGTEYMAANPLFVPGLAQVTRDCISPQTDGSHGAFDIPRDNAISEASPGDRFVTLPMELRLNILSHLTSQEIAQLRLTSRAFRQLPISLWHDLIVKDMPWLWEAGPAAANLPYPYLATTTEGKLRASPDIRICPVPVPNVLPQSVTNWHKLYCDVKRYVRNGELKGLRNRRRIWTDCSRIVNYIDKHGNANEESSLLDQWHTL